MRGNRVVEGGVMAREMCPACREVREMRVSSSTRTVIMPDGRKKRIRTISYHCELCHQFVRSEDAEEARTGGSKES